MRRAAWCAALAAAALAGSTPAAAQRGQPRRQTIEIRGQVPTPQVVTVRPREVPAFNRQVLVPAFYDHAFFPVVLPAYQLVQKSDITGREPTDTMPVVSGAPVVSEPGVTPATPVTPQVQPRQQQQAAPPATRNEEIEALRKELEARRARLDSIDAARKRQLDSLEAATRERQRRQLGDTLRKPPGTPSAPQR